VSDTENNERMERVVRYVEGDMDTAERAAFEAELAADPTLQDDLKAALTTLTGLEALAEQHLREKLRAVDVSLDAGSRQPQGPEAATLRQIQGAETPREGKGGGALRWWWAAAAGLVLVAGTGLWLFRPVDPQALAEAFAVEEPGLPVLMGTDPRCMDGIMNAYKQGDLTTAANLIALSLTIDPTNDTLHYFAGVIAEREADCAAAAPHYAEIKEGSPFAPRTQYRQALCALRAGTVMEARILLKQVAEGSDAQLADRARELLRRL